MAGNKKGGNIHTQALQAREAVISACKSSVTNDLEKVRTAIGVSKRIFYKKNENNGIECTVAYKHYKKQKRHSRRTELQKKFVIEFCHSDESSSVDSNRHKCIKIDGDDHAPRVWNVLTINEQYDSLCWSELAQMYANRYPGFKVP